MSRFKTSSLTSLRAALVVLAIAAGGCANNQSTANDAATSAPTDSVEEALRQAILDEYQAEATYRAVIADIGDVRPFSNIVTAERRHSQELAALFEQRGLAVPDNPWASPSSEPVPRFGSRADACAASVQAELDNIKLYDQLLEHDLPQDVSAVFRRLQDASRSRHLPAFERCAR